MAASHRLSLMSSLVDGFNAARIFRDLVVLRLPALSVALSGLARDSGGRCRRPCLEQLGDGGSRGATLAPRSQKMGPAGRSGDGPADFSLSHSDAESEPRCVRFVPLSASGEYPCPERSEPR
jgi:hypothetical protein